MGKPLGKEGNEGCKHMTSRHHPRASIRLLNSASLAENDHPRPGGLLSRGGGGVLGLKRVPTAVRPLRWLSQRKMAKKTGAVLLLYTIIRGQLPYHTILLYDKGAVRVFAFNIIHDINIIHNITTVYIQICS